MSILDKTMSINENLRQNLEDMMILHTKVKDKRFYLETCESLLKMKMQLQKLELDFNKNLNQIDDNPQVNWDLWKLIKNQFFE